MSNIYETFIHGLYHEPTMIDRYTHIPVTDQRCGVTITYSTPTGLSAWINDMWGDPPPYHHEPKLQNIKTSASVAILAEYMPDTTVRHTWGCFSRYCVNDALIVFDIETRSFYDRIEYPIFVDHYRRYNVTDPPHTFKDEPHWFKHDRKVRR